MAAMTAFSRRWACMIGAILLALGLIAPQAVTANDGHSGIGVSVVFATPDVTEVTVTFDSDIDRTAWVSVLPDDGSNGWKSPEDTARRHHAFAFTQLLPSTHYHYHIYMHQTQDDSFVAYTGSFETHPPDRDLAGTISASDGSIYHIDEAWVHDVDIVNLKTPDGWTYHVLTMDDTLFHTAAYFDVPVMDQNGAVTTERCAIDTIQYSFTGALPAGKYLLLHGVEVNSHSYDGFPNFLNIG